MQNITTIGIALIFIITATAQDNTLQLPLISPIQRLIRSTSSIPGRNNATEQIRNKKLQIASMVDVENLKFGLQLKSTSERRQLVSRKWTETELLNLINKRTGEILDLENIKEVLSEFLALGASPEEAVAAVAEHMDLEHMTTTVKHALDADYPKGNLPYWKANVAKKAMDEAAKLIKTLVQELQASLTGGKGGAAKEPTRNLRE